MLSFNSNHIKSASLFLSGFISGISLSYCLHKLAKTKKQKETKCSNDVCKIDFDALNKPADP
jgi:hypothetical protein